MDRRKSIKALLVGTAATGVLIESCNPSDKKSATATTEPAPAVDLSRTKEELEVIKKLNEQVFFTKEEMATITILADIIIPKDAVSGSATDAKVPDFIEFIVKDQPDNQVPMRGGLRWLQMESLKRFEKSFNDITEKQRI